MELRRCAPAVTQRLFDADEWDARSQALDSSEGSGLRTDLASVDPTLVSADPYHVWLLTVNGAIITVVTKVGPAHAVANDSTSSSDSAAEPATQTSPLW